MLIYFSLMQTSISYRFDQGFRNIAIRLYNYYFISNSNAGFWQPFKRQRQADFAIRNRYFCYVNRTICNTSAIVSGGTHLCMLWLFVP
jgi:hypothetical protein